MYKGVPRTSTSEAARRLAICMWDVLNQILPDETACPHQIVYYQLRAHSATIAITSEASSKQSSDSFSAAPTVKRTKINIFNDVKFWTRAQFALHAGDHFRGVGNPKKLRKLNVRKVLFQKSAKRSLPTALLRNNIFKGHLACVF